MEVVLGRDYGLMKVLPLNGERHQKRAGLHRQVIMQRGLRGRQDDRSVEPSCSDARAVASGAPGVAHVCPLNQLCLPHFGQERYCGLGYRVALANDSEPAR